MITAIAGCVLLVLWTIYVMGVGVLIGSVIFDPERRAQLNQFGKIARLMLATWFSIWPLALVVGLILDKKEKLED